jgi:Protein of unknown function (DUF3145)
MAELFPVSDRSRTRARGVVFIHSCPRAMSTHVAWAVMEAVGVSSPLEWIPQPIEPGCVRAELAWEGEPGSASRLVSALRTWPQMRFEVTEDPTPGVEGERYSSTPTLGVFRATIGINGDVLVGEERLRAALERAATAARVGYREDADPDADLVEDISRLLGQPWDDELEPFRIAGEDTPVRWLHRVG